MLLRQESWLYMISLQYITGFQVQKLIWGFTLWLASPPSYFVHLMIKFSFNKRIKMKPSQSKAQQDQSIYHYCGNAEDSWWLTPLWSKPGLKLNWLRGQREEEDRGRSSEKKASCPFPLPTSPPPAARRNFCPGILIDPWSLLVQY